jgi:hypothetical protein
MRSKEENVTWLQGHTTAYRLGKGDMAETVEEFDDMGSWAKVLRRWMN